MKSGFLDLGERGKDRVAEVGFVARDSDADRVRKRHCGRLLELIRIGLHCAVHCVHVIDIRVGTAREDRLNAVRIVVVKLDFRSWFPRRFTLRLKRLNEGDFDEAGVLGRRRAAHR